MHEDEFSPRLANENALTASSWDLGSAAPVDEGAQAGTSDRESKPGARNSSRTCSTSLAS